MVSLPWTLPRSILSSPRLESTQAITRQNSGELDRPRPVVLTLRAESRHTLTVSDAESKYEHPSGSEGQTSTVWSDGVEHMIADLGWTVDEAAEIRARLLSFVVGWSAPGMEAYDDL